MLCSLCVAGWRRIFFEAHGLCPRFYAASAEATRFWRVACGGLAVQGLWAHQNEDLPHRSRPPPVCDLTNPSPKGQRNSRIPVPGPLGDFSGLWGCDLSLRSQAMGGSGTKFLFLPVGRGMPRGGMTKGVA